MGEKILRYMVNEVNKLLETDYNMISFDSLSKNSLIQVFADCLTKLEALPKVEVERNTDASLSQILEVLSNIKVPLPQTANLNEFTDGIIQGKRSIVHPTLNWVLSNQNEVKKRAYFSKFLKKVPVPAQIISDPELQPLIAQYDAIIQEFKNVHLENTKFSKMGSATLELRKEIAKITNDTIKVKEQIEKQKNKVENIPNKESLMVSIKSFRNEVIQDKTLQKQLEDQNETILQLGAQIKKVNENLKRQKALRMGSGGLIGRLQEEVQTNRVIVQERLPQELAMLKKQAELIQIVATEPQPSQNELDDLQSAVDEASLDLQKQLESTLLNNDPRDDKLAQFRQHVTVIANNKQLAAESLMELKEEVSINKRKVEEKESVLHTAIGGTMPQGDELKKFVSKLRARSVVYKERRAQLHEVQAELGVLTRTLDILKQENFSLLEALQNKDSENSNEVKKDDKNVPDTTQGLTQSCKDLAKQLNNKKTDASLIRQELQTFKTQMEELSKDHERAKEVYDSSMSNFTAEIKKLEGEVKEMEKQIENEEETWKTIKKDIERKEDIMQKLTEDISQFGEGKKTQKDLLTEQITMEDDVRRELVTEMQKTMAEKEEREQQVILWYSTLELLKCKKQSLGQY